VRDKLRRQLRRLRGAAAELLFKARQRLLGKEESEGARGSVAACGSLAPARDSVKRANLTSFPLRSISMIRSRGSLANSFGLIE